MLIALCYYCFHKSLKVVCTKLSCLYRCLVMICMLVLIGWLGEHLYLSACNMFLIYRILLSDWIAVVSSMILIGVDRIDPVISINAWFYTLSSVYFDVFDDDEHVVDPYSRCGRIVHMYTFYNSASTAPHVCQLTFSEGIVLVLPLFLHCWCVVYMISVCWKSH